jgi:beta-N-acetylhexosaminidase
VDRRRWVPLVAVLVIATACTSSSTGTGTSSPSKSAPSSSPTATPSTTKTSATSSAPATSPPAKTSSTAAPLTKAQQVLAGMSEKERVGQLLMVDCASTGASAATNIAIGNYYVGSVILDGTSQLSIQQTAEIAAQLQTRVTPPKAKLFVATDQEGGQVQRLRGPGFSPIPSAVQQGLQAPDRLQSDAQQWGTQLRQAGVTVNLAPVLDTVPANFGSNPPIGDLDREYGHDPATVSSHGNAFARGLRSAGVDASVKHFPGLGRVTGNTDVTSGVTDSVTTRHDSYLAPFQDAVKGGVPFVMMSTAIYTRIDPDHPAAFSPTIVTGMLRNDLGFRGVIISDDVGNAAQVSGTSVGNRAVAFIAAGGTMVLTVDATQVPAMTAALLARAKSDKAFKTKVDKAALVVLQAKQDRRLLY